MPVVQSELMQHLRAGKDALREARRRAPLDEKLRQLVQAQHLYVQVAGSRRPLKPWQRPWNILNEVTDSVVIGVDGITPTRQSAAATTHVQWVRLQFLQI